MPSMPEPTDEIEDYEAWPDAKEERSERARAVLGRYLVDAYDGVCRDARATIFNGVTSHKPTSEETHLKNVFERMSDEDKQAILYFVKDRARATIFHTLCAFDGVSGSVLAGCYVGPYTDQIRLGVEVQKYVEGADDYDTVVVDTVPINPDYMESMDLHDDWRFWINNYSKTTKMKSDVQGRLLNEEEGEHESL